GVACCVTIGWYERALVRRGRPRLSLPRLPRAAVSLELEGSALQRRLRYVHHALEAPPRREPGVRRGGLGSSGTDLPRGEAALLQGNAPRDAGRPAQPDRPGDARLRGAPTAPSGSARLRGRRRAGHPGGAHEGRAG